MKVFFSENQPDYSTYTFNYAVYAVAEAQHELPTIYQRGFLPYTGDLRIGAEVFYLARSLRVELDRFAATSENRRIHRKMEPLDVQIRVLEKATFDYQQPDFLKFCLNYASDRFSGNAMNAERLAYVLQKRTGTHLLAFYRKDQVVGYVLAAIEGNTFHYWYAFFDQQYMQSHSLGKWMMWSSIHWAKSAGLAYVYLGTCYGTHSLYKVRDHKGLAFYDGGSWNQDIKQLKALCKSDREPLTKDRFKQMEQPDAYIAALPSLEVR